MIVFQHKTGCFKRLFFFGEMKSPVLSREKDFLFYLAGKTVKADSLTAGNGKGRGLFSSAFGGAIRRWDLERRRCFQRERSAIVRLSLEDNLLFSNGGVIEQDT